MRYAIRVIKPSSHPQPHAPFDFTGKTPTHSGDMPTRAVLLLNPGSPDSTVVPDVKRYLREFLGDERASMTGRSAVSPAYRGPASSRVFA